MVNNVTSNSGINNNKVINSSRGNLLSLVNLPILSRQSL